MTEHGPVAMVVVPPLSAEAIPEVVESLLPHLGVALGAGLLGLVCAGSTPLNGLGGQPVSDSGAGEAARFLGRCGPTGRGSHRPWRNEPARVVPAPDRTERCYLPHCAECLAKWMLVDRPRIPDEALRGGLSGRGGDDDPGRSTPS